MPSPQAAPHLVNIRLHPIKSLDPVSVPEARISPSGGLALDRAWALYSLDGKWVNGKRTQAIHLIRASYTPDLREVTLSVPGDRREIPTRTFAFPGAYEDAAEWFSVFFEQQIIVRYSENGFPDDTVASGPTIVSTASLESVSEWFGPTPQGFPGVSVDEARQRFRATLEINGVPAFWEDQLFGEDERSVVRFKIGEINFEGSNPCARCPVPPRNPQTGEILEGFQKTLHPAPRIHSPALVFAPPPLRPLLPPIRTNTPRRPLPKQTNSALCVGDPLHLS